MSKYNPTPEEREIEHLQAQGINGTAAKMLIQMQKKTDNLEKRIDYLRADMRLALDEINRLDNLVERLRDALSPPIQE